MKTRAEPRVARPSVQHAQAPFFRAKERSGPAQDGPTLPFFEAMAADPEQQEEPLQAKLTVGEAGDRHEEEADRVADQVVATSDQELQRQTEPDEGLQAAPQIQRMCKGCEREAQRQPVEKDDEQTSTELTAGEEEQLRKVTNIQKKNGSPAARDGSGPAVPTSIASDIQQAKRGGHPLPEASRTFMEPRFGTSFEDVRVHSDQASASLNRALHARAFTVGNDVFFGRGEYNPATSSGKHLLAHELTHTLQQSGGVTSASAEAVQRKIGVPPDLTAPRFVASAVLDAVLENRRTLKNGSSGAAVGLVQQALVDLGYELPRFGVDNDFGDETEAAVRAFQVDAGAGVDGEVGPETMRFLDSRVQGQPVVAPPAPVIGAPLPAASVIAQPGAAPSIPLAGACHYGLTFPENVRIDIGAVRNGANWQPVVTGLTGNYSLQARLVPGVAEVTGPGGNTNAGNYCNQVTDLNNLVNTGGCALNWYMRSAIVAHERVHAAFFRPALVAAAPAIEAAVEALRVPHVAGMNAASAATAIRALPAFAAAATNAQVLWLGQILPAGGHPAVNAATAAAERTIVDPMIRRICRHAARQGWPACSPPC